MADPTPPEASGPDRKRPVPVRDTAPAPPRPTPVREAMDAPRDEAPEVEPPTVEFARGEETWIARVIGRAATGRAADSGTPLLLVGFAPAEDPDTARFESLCVAHRLTDLTDADLVAALEGARPFDGEWQRSDLFKETRRGDRGR